MNATYYAIGDVHGMAGKLEALHERILAEHQRRDTPSVVVHLGDYVDRGADSRGAVQRVIDFERGADERMTTVSLRGNHEQMMLDAIAAAGVESMEAKSAVTHWLGNGGREALASYMRANGERATLSEAIDPHHVDWLKSLPTIHLAEERKLAFVHGGIDPQTFPDCDDEVRIWTRSARFFETKRWPKRAELAGWCIIHGHTPTQDLAPFADARRINVDTGAVYGGPLTCVALDPDGPPRFLCVE